MTSPPTGFDWFTADLHLGHENIIGYSGRPFTTLHEMDRALVDAWNERVGDDETIVVVGDLALGWLRHSLATAAKLRGRKFLVPGNHDKCWSGKAKGSMAAGMYEAAGFRVLPSQVRLTIAGQAVTVCHFPYAVPTPDHVDRFAAHRPANSGGWLLHGHVHTAWKVRGRQINVGVDVWDQAPVPVQTIEALIRSGPGS